MSRSTYTAPEITVDFTNAMEHRQAPFVLMATSHGQPPAIVGPRILRGNGVLSIDVRHPTKEAAEEAAAKLRAYLASLGKEKAGKGEEIVAPRVRGHWED